MAKDSDVERPGVRPIVLGALLLTITYSCVSERSVEPQCACDCHGNPACEDTVFNVFDVVWIVNVAYRGSDPIIDPNPACPYEDTDVNCDGETDSVDAYLAWDVLIGTRDHSLICDPCAP